MLTRQDRQEVLSGGHLVYCSDRFETIMVIMKQHLYAHYGWYILPKRSSHIRSFQP